MRFVHFFYGFALASFLVVLPAAAQRDSRQAQGRRTQDLVESLDKLVTKAEKERTADRQLLQELRDLVRRFDWPWQEELLYDDFSDGEFLKNPTWAVISGRFRVDQERRLTTEYTPAARPNAQASRPKEEDLGTAIVGILLDELQKRKGRPEESRAPEPPTRAEIHTRLGISNAFVIKLNMISRGDERRLELGPYQGAERESGYRLVYRRDQRSAFELLRVSPGRSAVIELVELDTSLDDGKEHTLEWRRGVDGKMAVLVDGRELMQARDRSFKGPFNGFLLVNGGGAFSFSLVEILGTEKG